jgi:hypothetical protein
MLSDLPGLDDGLARYPRENEDFVCVLPARNSKSQAPSSKQIQNLKSECPKRLIQWQTASHLFLDQVCPFAQLAATPSAGRFVAGHRRVAPPF